MTTIKIEKRNLKEYLEHLSGRIPTELVEIELAGLDVGDQIEAEWVSMTGIGFDPDEDVVSIELENGKLEHVVREPVEFWVEEEGAHVRAINIVSGDGLQHLIRLKEPKKLPLSG